MKNSKLIPFMRVILLLAAVLVFIAGFQLFILTEQTDTYFSWTINPFLTAAFLGASYWASGLLEYLAGRQITWARARIAVIPVFVFTVLTLIATLLHLDKFHFDSTVFVTAAATWMWLAIYVTVPALMALALFRQGRAPSAPSLPGAPLAGWARILLATLAFTGIIFGLILFLAPFLIQKPEETGAFFARIWPWQLSALTGRAIGAWLIGLGLALGQAARDNNIQASAIAFPSFALFGLLQLVALLRYGAQIDWGGVPAWLYLAFLGGILIAGLQGLWAARRLEERQSPGQSQ